MQTLLTYNCGDFIRVCLIPWRNPRDSQRTFQSKAEWTRECMRFVNLQNSKERFAAKLGYNFSSEDWFITLTLSEEYRTADWGQLRAYWRAALRRLRYLRRKRGAPPPRYCYIMERYHSKDEPHLHVILQRYDAQDGADVAAAWPYSVGVDMLPIRESHIIEDPAGYLTKEMRRPKLDFKLFAFSRSCRTPQAQRMRVPDDFILPEYPGFRRVRYREQRVGSLCPAYAEYVAENSTSFLLDSL